MQFWGQISMSFSPKKCLREQNLQGFIETEVMQLGMLQWHQKEGKRRQISFFGGNRCLQSISNGSDMAGSQELPFLEHKFGLILMIGNLRAPTRDSPWAQN